MPGFLSDGKHSWRSLPSPLEAAHTRHTSSSSELSWGLSSTLIPSIDVEAKAGSGSPDLGCDLSLAMLTPWTSALSYPHNITQYYTARCVCNIFRLHKAEQLSH